MRSIKKIDLLMKAKESIRYLKIEYLTGIQLQGYVLYIRLVVFFFFLMMPQVARADTFGSYPRHLVMEQANASNINITIEPEFPITGEATQITASGTWHNSCVPKFHSATVSNAFGDQDAIIQGVLSEEEGCDDTITEWSLTKPLVFEKAALTMLQFTIQSGPVDSESQSSSVRYANTHFFVHDGITFQPSMPGVDEQIQITISGWTVSCVPTYQSHMIKGKTIVINIGVPEWAEVCGQSIAEWEEEIDIGTLSAGRYRVEAHVRMIGDTSPKLLHATTLAVGNPSYQIFIPIIKANRKPSTGEPCSVDLMAENFCH